MTSTVSTRLYVAVGIALLGVVVTVPLWADQGVLFFTGGVVIAALFAMAWNLLFSYAGLASFGHAAFYALGAYFVGVSLKAYPTGPYLLFIAGAMLTSGLVALLIGAIVLRRLSGIHLAIVTMAIAELVRILIGYSLLLGREDGLPAIPRPILSFGIFDLSLHSDAAFFWFICLFFAAAVLAMWWLTHSRYGRVLRAICQDQERASFLGIEVARYQLAAFALSGAFAAAAGALAAPWVQIVTPELISIVHSTQPILNTLLGGTGFWGPVVGAGVFGVIDYMTRAMMGATEIVMGVTILAVILLFPHGLTGLIRDLVGRTDSVEDDAQTAKTGENLQ